MPPLTRWFVRAALVYFVLALFAGAWLLAGPALGLAGPRGVQPVYLHLFMVGWVTQLILGVAYWMFPKYTQARPRGDERLGWAVFWLLNAGLWLRMAGEPWWAATQARGPAVLLAVSALLQWLAGVGFVLNTWARVKEK